MFNDNTFQKHPYDEMILYHYCSVDSFFSIINGKSLWLSDIYKSNDFMERKLLLFAVATELDNLIQKGEIHPAIQKDIFDEIQLLENVQYAMPSLAHVVCFSSLKDSLSQWRGYAEDGTGLAIGFKAKYLASIITDKINFIPIIYNANTLQENSKLYANGFVDMLTAYSDPENNNEILKVLNIGVSNKNILFEACKYKPAGFREESEFRLIFNNNTTALTDYKTVFFTPSDISEFNGNNTNFILSPMKYRSRDKILQSYFELNFSHIADDFIAEIIIGPKSKVTVEDVMLFLGSCGYNICDPANTSFCSFTNLKISKSSLTYR